MIERILSVGFCCILGPVSDAIAKVPDCTGANGWPTAMAFVHMKNAGLTDNAKIDFTKTTTVRLASERIGRKDLYRQVHLVTYTEKAGKVIEAITVSDASNAECSESDVQVYVVSEHLGAQRKIR